MTEEQVTKAIMKWLITTGWDVVCFDFPQSGTGRLLHPNDSSDKNKGAINPDIVAVKNGVCLFFENKDRYYPPDFEKVNNLIKNNMYTNSIAQLLAGKNVATIYYGIGMPTNKYGKPARDSSALVDFVVGVQENRQTEILYHPAHQIEW